MQAICVAALLVQHTCAGSKQTKLHLSCNIHTSDACSTTVTRAACRCSHKAAAASLPDCCSRLYPAAPQQPLLWVLAGGHIETQQADYLYASLPARGLGGSTIDVEFLCAKSDKTVAIRAATRRASLPDAGSCYKAIEELRHRLGWDEVSPSSSHLTS